MSHELRTPLNSLLILARVLRGLLRLLNDIMELAEIEAGTITPEISEVVLADVQDDLKREFGQVAYRRRLSFSVGLAGGLPPTIATDPARLRRVLDNLLANAIKFTEYGAVTCVSALPPAAGAQPTTGSHVRTR